MIKIDFNVYLQDSNWIELKRIKKIIICILGKKNHPWVHGWRRVLLAVLLGYEYTLVFGFQHRLSGEVFIHFSGTFPSFADGPDDE